MGVDLQEEKTLSPRITEVEKGLESDGPVLLELPSLHTLNEKEIDKNDRSEKERLLPDNGRIPTAPLAAPETPGDELIAFDSLPSVKNTDDFNGANFKLTKLRKDVKEAETDSDDVDQLDGAVSRDEAGVIITQEAPIPDPNNWYQVNKNLAQGMMDLALLSANANQLRYVMDSSTTHPFYYASLTFITLSLLFQVAVGIGLILSSRYDLKLVNQEEHFEVAHRINNWTVGGVFIVTILNVFITAFSVSSSTSQAGQVKQSL